ncbi:MULTISPECIES: hypothetical protein [Microbacterium]|uniref:hypothetical protein n=1 Tax=Microbacterium TaxID=33882 RepID=UPI000B88A963|nr:MULTISPECIES: hypothetical protein [Microbacterium]NJI57825.1 hypothetical protein [Microbacterium sp. B19(2022)]
MDHAPREVDERDTQWEKSALDLRVFIQDTEGRRETFDLDETTLDAAEQWAASRADRTSAISIAMRAVDDQGRLGLVWLIADAED